MECASGLHVSMREAHACSAPVQRGSTCPSAPSESALESRKCQLVSVSHHQRCCMRMRCRDCGTGARESEWLGRQDRRIGASHWLDCTSDEMQMHPSICVGSTVHSLCVCLRSLSVATCRPLTASLPVEQCCGFRVPRPWSGSGSMSGGSERFGSSAGAMAQGSNEVHSAACDHPGHCLDRTKYNTYNTNKQHDKLLHTVS